jgi:hypothetical protein
MLSALFVASLGAGTALASLDLVERASNAQTCIVPSHGNVNVSDTPAILAAFKQCGNGGRIVFSEGTTYAVNELTVSWNISLRQSSDSVPGDDPVHGLHSRIGRNTSALR